MLPVLFMSIHYRLPRVCSHQAVRVGYQNIARAPHIPREGRTGSQGCRCLFYFLFIGHVCEGRSGCHVNGTQSIDFSAAEEDLGLLSVVRAGSTTYHSQRTSILSFFLFFQSPLIFPASLSTGMQTSHLSAKFAVLKTKLTTCVIRGDPLRKHFWGGGV